LADALVTLFREELAASQLQVADPAAWRVAAGWQPSVRTFFQSTEGQRLLAYLRKRIDAGAVIFPPQPLRALELTAPDAVRLVILGQDPYHGRGQAEGLAFSVTPGVPLPPSLRNIFKELQRDLGLPMPIFPEPGGSLTAWAKNGVLLLNTCLTVEERSPNRHRGQGWEALTDLLLQKISRGDRRVVFMLWGIQAQAKRELIDETRHLVLSANHPSPLSALRPPTPFSGCGHFSRARSWLLGLDAAPAEGLLGHPFD
jgi:uracil-DNA glycosylase